MAPANTKKELEQTNSLSLPIVSYSGADIRVSIRVYDGGSFRKRRLAVLNKDYKDLRAQITLLDGEVEGVDALRKGIGLPWQGTTTSPPLYRDTNTSLSKNVRAGVADAAEHQKSHRIYRNMAQLRSEEQAITTEIARLTSQPTGDMSLIELEEIQTLSYSIYRDKFPVRALGSTYVRGYTAGMRTVAGSMIFTVFNEHVLNKILLTMGARPNDTEISSIPTTTLADQLPPIDIQVNFANEFGDQSYMVIYGVEFVQEGQTMSIEDLLLEQVIQYVARDIDPMRSSIKREIDELGNVSRSPTASSLFANQDVQAGVDRMRPFVAVRFKNGGAS